MQLYNTVLYKDLKKRVNKADWPVVRRALHDVVQKLGVYSESNKWGVILDTRVDGAFVWARTAPGHDFWLDVVEGRPVGRSAA